MKNKIPTKIAKIIGQKKKTKKRTAEKPWKLTSTINEVKPHEYAVSTFKWKRNTHIHNEKTRDSYT